VTPEQLAEIEARAERHRLRTPWPDDTHPDLLDLEHLIGMNVPALLAEVKRLRFELAKADQENNSAGKRAQAAEAERDALRTEFEEMTKLHDAKHQDWRRAEADRDRAREIAVALEQENARLERIVGAVANLKGRWGTLDEDTRPRHWIALSALSDRVRGIWTPALPAPDVDRLERLDGLVKSLRRLCGKLREHPEHGEVYADILDRIEKEFPLPSAALEGGEGS
jgi:hypothetical protein